MVKLCPRATASGDPFESVVILDSGKTSGVLRRLREVFESVVILDSGKTTWMTP